MAVAAIRVWSAWELAISAVCSAVAEISSLALACCVAVPTDGADDRGQVVLHPVQSDECLADFVHGVHFDVGEGQVIVGNLFGHGRRGATGTNRSRRTT